MLRTAVVILNWNGLDFLKKYLGALVTSVDSSDDRVFVADNASTDGSLEFLESEYPDVPVISLDRNYGFTGGYNRALQQIEAEYYVLMNSDVEVEPDWLFPLVEWMQLHPDCGVCGPKMKSLADRSLFEYAGAAGGLIDMLGYPLCRGRVMGHVQKDEGQYDIPENVFWVGGACMMVRASLWHSLGGLCEEFFAHQEEIDFCWRARLAGWKVSCVPRSTVYHLGGGTLAGGSPWKLQLNYRNNLLMLRRNLPLSYALENFWGLVAALLPDAIYPDDFRNLSEFCMDELSDGEVNGILAASVSDALSRTRRTLRLRMFLDRVSAVIYLLRGRADYFRAVRTAHREYRAMRGAIDRDAIGPAVLDDMEKNGGRVARVMLDVDLTARKMERVNLHSVLPAIVPLREAVWHSKVFEHLES
ncbi:MAG: glycosyltransferase family 2 protein [Bacteroidales bacterium]|nr:glycosyltransferase family 2 protein [Bacteroidales bacterium]